MSEELDSAVSSLSEQTKKINIALYYVSGDMERAKQMVAGTYKDIYAIKGVFLSTSLNGAFLIFYNFVYLKLIDIYLVVMPSYASMNMDSKDTWKLFERSISDSLKGDDHDDVLEKTLRDRFYQSFSMMLVREVNKLIDKGDDIALNRLFQRMIQDILGLQRIEMVVDYQPISSLEMELYSISTRKLDLKSLGDKKPAEKEGVKIPEISPDSEPQVGVDGVKLILKCSLILSPIKGKDISTLGAGDRVKMSIVDENPKAVTVAEFFNAYKDGKFAPIIGRVKSVKFVPGSGYVIYALIAKGILAKIVEEEDNIKVAMDPNYSWSKAEEPESKSNLPMILILLAVVAILVLVVLGLIKLI